MLQEFRDFINRGNVMDLAVAVVVGAAFTAIVTSFSEDILGGILAAVGGEPDFSDAFVLTIGEGQIRFGAFLTAVLNFLIVAFAVFLVVKGVNQAQKLRQTPAQEAAEATISELEVLEEIRDLLRDRQG